MNIQLGSGTVFLDGFDNTDLPSIDIRNPLPYGDDSADIIVAAHVLELFILRDVAFALREIHRVLKLGGWLRMHFGSERFDIEAWRLADSLVQLGGGMWKAYAVDKVSTMTGSPGILKAKGQHGPALVVELQKI